MRTFVTAVLVLLGVSYAKGCSQVAVQKCFEDMGRNLGRNNLGPSELFTLVSPENEHKQQLETCNALKDYNFNSVKTCITVAGCSTTSVLPANMAGSPTQPVFTWTNITDMLEGLCEPGCDNLNSKHKDAENCSQKIKENQGSDLCSGLDQAFGCYRKVIGDCEVLVTFTESLLKSSGIMDNAKQQCPELDLTLKSEKMAVIAIDDDVTHSSYKVNELVDDSPGLGKTTTASIISTLAVALIAVTAIFS